MTGAIYFEKNHLQPAKGEYVLWCDGMGTGQELHRNLDNAAVFVFQMHMAFSKAREGYENVRFYPVMDGMYITTPCRETLEDLIAEAFSTLAKMFIGGYGTKNKFMIRGGIAYGPVIHGEDISDDAFKGVEIEHSLKSAILLSPAMVAANKVETQAPPFGIYVDDSAKVLPVLADPADKGFISSLFQWWNRTRHEEYRPTATRLYEQINFYFKKAEAHSVGMNYNIDRIKAHKKIAEEYFGGLSTEH